MMRPRALLVLFTATATLLAGCAIPSPAPHVAPAVREAVGEATYQLIQEPDQGYGPVISVINQAHRTIRVTMYELADPSAVTTLIAAHGRGVDTRVLLDAAFHGRTIDTPAFDQLTAAGVNVRWAPDGVIYHQKTTE